MGRLNYNKSADEANRLRADNRRNNIQNTNNGLALYLHRISFNYGSELGVLLSDVGMYSNVPANDHVTSTGVVYSYFISLKLLGTLSLIGNSDTVLFLIGSQALAYSNSSIIIHNNILSFGRLVVMECTVLTLSEKTLLKFADNSNVSVVLFSVCGSDEEESGSECFLQYTNRSLHPDNWKTKLLFSGNSGCAPNDNDWNCNYNSDDNLPALIFDANILSCVWPGSGSDNLSVSILNSAFRWKPFEYFNSIYSSMIMSGPTELRTQSDENPVFELGDVLYPLVEVYNYLENEITNKVALKVCIVEDVYYFTSLSSTSINQMKCWYEIPTDQAMATILAYPDTSWYSGTCNVINISQIHLDITTVGTNELEVRIPVTFVNNTWNTPPLQCLHGTLKISCSSPKKYCLKRYFDSDYYSPSKCNDYCFDANKTYYINNIYLMHDGFCFWANENRSLIIFGNCPQFLSKYYHQPYGTTAETFCTPNTTSITSNCEFGRQGVMCGQCQSNLTVSFTSVYLECIDCDQQPYAKGWLVFIGVQMIPLTVFLLLLMFFGVSLNYLSTNAYILYSQMVTLWFPGYSYPSWFSFKRGLAPRFAMPYCMWSLSCLLLPSGYFPFEYCLFHGMTTIQVIAFQYIFAVYPLLVILLIFTWLEMYARGVRPVFYITRQLLHMLARLSQKLNIKRSLTDTFSVMYVLSFTQLARVSGQLLTFTTLTIYNTTTNKVHHERVFYYDGSLAYFGGEHLPYGLLAIVVLIVFVIVPSVLLLLYPFKFFQRKLSLLRLEGPGIAAVVDGFCGSFRDGSAGDRIDARFLAGVFLIFRIFFITLYSVPLGTYFSILQIILFSECVVCLAMAGLILLIRPNKTNSTHVIDFLLFLNLGLGAFICAVYNHNDNNYFGLSLMVLIQLWLPAIGLFCFFLIKF